MTIAEIIAAIRSADAKAVPGPWDNEQREYLYARLPGGRPNGEYIGCFRAVNNCLTREQNRDNAALATVARNHILALCDEIERLQAEVSGLLISGK